MSTRMMIIIVASVYLICLGFALVRNSKLFSG